MLLSVSYAIILQPSGTERESQLKKLPMLLVAILMMASFSFATPASPVEAGVNGQHVRFECHYITGTVYYAGYNQNGVWTTWSGPSVGGVYVNPSHLWWEGQLNITYTKLPNSPPSTTTKTYNIPTVHFQDTWFAYC